MISIDQIEIARENWQKAADELKFKIITPYYIFINGKRKEVFAFFPEILSRNGAIVELTASPDFSKDKDILEWANSNGCFCSFANIEFYLKYDKDYFLDVLLDWQIVTK